MEETKWFRWLRSLTKESSERAMAKRVGVSHTTVQRWVRSGVPPNTAWKLCVRFKGDPIQLIVLLGKIQPEHVPVLNWYAVVRYVPAEVLTAEVHARTVRVLRETPGTDPRKLSPAV